MEQAGPRGNFAEDEGRYTIIATREGHKTLQMTLKVARQRDRTNIEEEEMLAQRKAAKLRMHQR